MKLFISYKTENIKKHFDDLDKINKYIDKLKSDNLYFEKLINTNKRNRFKSNYVNRWSAFLSSKETKYVLVLNKKKALGRWQSIEYCTAVKNGSEIYYIDNDIFIDILKNALSNKMVVTEFVKAVLEKAVPKTTL